MRADDHVYATRPDGIPDGDPFPEFFGEQWGSVAGFLGLDLIHLRDGFFGPLLYTRVGPYGTVASADPDENRTWTDAVRRLFRACKEAHPDGLVMAYSSGISGTAEWLTGCVDLEAIVADGALDIFIDQTWGGAWQDWWDDTWKGWTFQLAYLLGHGAQIRGGNERRSAPCRQYNLIETWDGWEPWDTLHDTPGKLEWATWAFSHAAVVGRDGTPVVPEGTYISWMNDWNERLISEADVAFLARHLDAAQASASGIEAVYGPLLVHDRHGLGVEVRRGSRLERERMGRGPRGDGHEVRCLDPGCDPGRVVAGDMARGRPVATPERGGHGPSRWTRRADRRHRSSRPDRPGVPRRGRRRADRRATGRRLPPRHAVERRPAARGTGPPPGAGRRLRRPRTRGSATTRQGMPLLVGRSPFFHWQPPDLADPGNPLVPHSQIGSTSPYVEAARVLNAGAAEAGGISVDPGGRPRTGDGLVLAKRRRRPSAARQPGVGLDGRCPLPSHG